MDLTVSKISFMEAWDALKKHLKAIKKSGTIDMDVGLNS